MFIIKENYQIISFCSGYAHNLILKSNGQVYSFGRNLEGQLGLGDNTDRNTPTFVASGVVKISCGEYHSMILQSIFTCFGITASNPSVCSGNGICTGIDQCSCGSYYFGTQCQTTKCFGKDSTDPSVCSGNGNCTTLDNCQCKQGYGGRQCQEDYLKNDFPIAYSFGYSPVFLLKLKNSLVKEEMEMTSTLH
jgi:hypothetical protein